MALKEKKLKVPAKSFYGTGKRKCSIAKVWIFEGSGKVFVNDMNPEEYFNNKYAVSSILNPLNILNLSNKYDVKISLLGGGKSSQIDSCILGLSRALIIVNPEYKSSLKEYGFLTRDSRVKERKKYGLRGARKAPQYRKR